MNDEYNGGSIINGITDLAVPFAILLAKQGIHDYINKKDDDKNMSGGNESEISAMERKLDELTKALNSACENMPNYKNQ